MKKQAKRRRRNGVWKRKAIKRREISKRKSEYISGASMVHRDNFLLLEF